jgi:addiction module HigA family antidote
MTADIVMGPSHPGEILLEEFLRPLAVSQYQLAKQIGVPARRINEIVHGQRRISADTALLGAEVGMLAFRIAVERWMEADNDEPFPLHAAAALRDLQVRAAELDSRSRLSALREFSET